MQDTPEAAPAAARDCPTRTTSGIFVTRRAKKDRRMSQYFRLRHFVASSLAAAMALALALTTAWDERHASADSVSCGINEITFTTGGFFGNKEPSINSDGTRIAFVSDHDLTGGNADGDIEIFLYDTTTNSFTQVTNTTGGGNEFPVLSGDGTRIAFESNRDLTGGNADGNVEIFLFDMTTNSFTQVTNTTGGGNEFASINNDGTRIAFRSDRDLTGDNADGNLEIFLYDTTTSRLTQVTSTSGGFNDTPAINGDGTHIAFVSNRFP